MKHCFQAIMICMLLLIFLFGKGVAQDHARFVNYGAAEGLSDNTVKQVAQDAKGFIWVATHLGLNRFDGYQFKTFHHLQSDPTSIASSEILSLYVDVKKRLWVGTAEGLDFYDPIKQQFIHYRHDPDDPNSLPSNEIRVITGDQQGNLWIGTYSDGIAYFNTETKQATRYQAEANQKNSLRSNKVRALCLDSRGNLWVGHSKSGISCLNISQQTFTHYTHQTDNSTSISEDRINTIFESTDGVIWIGAYTKGLNAYYPEKKEFVRYFKSPKFNLHPKAVKSIIEDHKGRLWIATWGDGIFVLNKERNQFKNYEKNLDYPASLSDNQALCLFQDNAQQIWIGTEYELNRLDPSTEAFEHIYHQKDNPNSLADNNIYSLLATTNHELWVGTYNSGVQRIDLESGTFHQYKNGPKSNMLTSKSVWYIHQGKEERLWLGCSGSLCLYNPETDDFTRYLNTPDRLQRETILCVYETDDGTVWMGTWGTGLVAYHPETDAYQVYSHDAKKPTSISTNSVRSLFVDSQKRFWVGTYDGLNLFDRSTGTFQRFLYDSKEISSISHNSISVIFEDHDHRIWIGTGGGLNLYIPEQQRFKRFTHLGKASPIGVKSIKEDQAGYLWLSTAQGICKFDPNTQKAMWFDEQDGLQGDEFTTGAATQTPDGKLYFGGKNGVTSFHPTEITMNSYPPPVVITNLLLFNKVVPINDSTVLNANLNYVPELELNYDENIFAFDFSALNYRQAEKNSYRYKLEGIDDYWVLANHLYRRATYTRIKPGTYTFRLQAANDDGVWNEQGLAIKVVILPPWWQTWWAKFLWIVLPIGVVVFIYQARVSSLKKQKRLLEQQVEERTAEIRESNKLLEVQKAEIQEQATDLMQANEEILTQKESIEEAYTNVQILSKIGKDVTANLSLSTIVDAAYENIGQLMDITEFGVGVIDEERQELVFKDYIYLNERLPEVRVPMSNQHRLAVYCAQHNQELLLGDIQYEFKQYIPKLEGYAEGDLLNSLLCIPLSTEGKAKGVISVQSLRKNAYSNIHLNMLRNIAVYLNIALDNADAYAQIESQKNKLLELDQFKEGLTSMIVHDLKNPLNAIINASDNDAEESLSKVKQAGTQMLNMVLNILDVNKYENSKMVVDPAPQVLHQLINQAIRNVAFLAKQKNISLQYQLPLNLIVQADHEIVERVFINLLTNAIKYTPNNGQVHISVEESSLNQSLLTIQVTDTGAGIQEEVLGKVFDKFGQVQAKKSGSVRSTGLGLTFCKMAVEAHGGTIGVSSQVDEGSTFWFTLPQLTEETNLDQTSITIDASPTIQLDEADRQLLAPYLPELKTAKVYQFSKINKLLAAINKSASPSLKEWTAEVKDCLFVMNEEKYAKLLEIAEVNPS